MFRVFLCIGTQHDWRLTALAALVCLPSAWATFFLYSKTPAAPVWRRWAWLAMTGLVAGSGIWTTHFVAMLAFRTGLPTGYAVGPTIGSLVVAVASTTLGFAIGAIPAVGRRRTLAVVVGGLVVGVGVTLMHYVGMSGYRTTGVLQWDLAYVAASLLIGTLCGAAALLVSRPRASLERQIASGGLLSLAIVGMHFTGMTAVTIVPDAGMKVPESLISDAMMVTLAVGVTGLIVVTSILGVAFDNAFRNGHLRRLREALDVMPDGLAFYDAFDRLVAWTAGMRSFAGRAARPWPPACPSLTSSNPN